MKTNPNEPLNCNNGNGFYNDEYNHTHAGIGLTKREYFAAMAMQGLLSAVYSSKDMLDAFTVSEDKIRKHLTGCDAISVCAINYADALIAELNKGDEK